MKTLEKARALGAGQLFLLPGAGEEDWQDVHPTNRLRRRRMRAVSQLRWNIAEAAHGSGVVPLLEKRLNSAYRAKTVDGRSMRRGRFFRAWERSQRQLAKLERKRQAAATPPVI